MQSTLNEADSAVAWEKLSPHLETAMGKLSERDRALLVLRFYENKTGPEAAALLGIREDAAHKRLARAVEKLRKIFAQRGVTLTATAIAGAVAANAVQAAPTVMIAAISTAALSGITTTTAAVIAAKAIAMTTLQKTLITTALVASVGAGVYQAKQAHDARAEVQSLQQQQAPLAEQIRQLQKQFTHSTNQLADLLAENARLKSNPHEMELLKLRGEVGVLRNSAQQFDSDPTVQLAREWKVKEAKLRQLFEQRPDQKIPEMQMLSDEQWLNAAKEADLDSTQGIRFTLSRVREIATLNFAASIQQALHTYKNANDGQLPSNPSQLSSYFRPPVANSDAMLLRYEMLGDKAQGDTAFKGACIIQKELTDKSIDNALIVGEGTMGFAPKPNRAPVDIPQELLPVLKAYMDANNRKTPLDFDELKPYITTPEQRTALEKFVNAVNQ